MQILSTEFYGTNSLKEFKAAAQSSVHDGRKLAKDGEWTTPSLESR